MAATIKASSQGLIAADTARRHKGWTKTDTRLMVTANVSIATLKRFWRGHAIAQDAFVTICKALGVDWQEVTELNSEHLQRLLDKGVEAWNQWKHLNPPLGYKLDDGNFSNAELKGVDFSNTSLIRAKLNGANLEQANLSCADLTNANLIRANLKGVSLNEASLIGANLNGANLERADLSRADLTNANLNGANLREANLNATQALSTIFTGVFFTGACLEDWNINSATKLDNIDCQYIYLKGNQQERRPSTGEFTRGEFTKLFQKALETVDLIFNNGIDWTAFLTSFQKLQVECSGQELSIQAIENKNDGAFVIRVNVPSDANKAEIEKYLKREYELILKAKDEQILFLREEIVSKRQQNTDLLGIIKTIAEKENYSRIINIKSDNYNECIPEKYIQGDYINMSQDVSVAAAQIQERLTQLQNESITVEVAQIQVAKDMATQAKSNPGVMGKLVKWGQSLGDTGAKTTVTEAPGNTAANTSVAEAAKEVFKLALRLSGIPIP